MADTAFQARSLYRNLLRFSDRFSSYNFREYARRRTRDVFREHKNVEDPRKIQELMQKGLKELQVLKRQTMISQFFQMDRLVVEGGALKGRRGGIKKGKMPARISFYRPNGQSRRQARSAHDHDVFEGLPVRRWSRQWVHVGKSAPLPPPEPELPLPKETHLLPPMSQALLQAARSSSQGKPAAKPAHIPGQQLFQTKRWMQTPRHLEPPEPVYLAKPLGGKRKRTEVEPPPPPVVAPVRRRVPPPKRKAKPRGRRPGYRKTVTFAAEGNTEGAPETGAITIDPAPVVEAPPVPPVTTVEVQEVVQIAAPTALALEKKKGPKGKKKGLGKKKDASGKKLKKPKGIVGISTPGKGKKKVKVVATPTASAPVTATTNDGDGDTSMGGTEAPAIEHVTPANAILNDQNSTPKF
ncbi:unnamed protein product [Tuber melanosporum]|uniref:(Perigord truffle) hypothetical protein n=1 Tax=Tuber melanosporum (strain Mel28) TaxID=656061 RepID=D5G7Z8_TUBMM|nr:uncharacterized protein GSTUM_00002746001 [Tuber melanosporum]CAZ80641.1 unnamed protein product [Tuber melanosporum]